MTVREGRCACGAVTFTAEGDPAGQGVCSCLHCQRRTGSVMGVAARYDEDKVVLTGETAAFRRTSDEGNETTFRFCPACGTTLAWQNTAMRGFTLVAVGCMADREFPLPKMSVFGERRPAWVTLADAIPEYRDD
jgi:hypothetical protein